VDNVDIIFGLDNPALEAIKPVINDSDELMFTLGNESSIEKDNVFEIIPWAAGLFTALGQEASDKYEKIAVVYATDWQLAETNKGLFYDGLGNKDYVEISISPNSDVRTEITKMLQQDIDAYTLFLPLEQGVKVLNEVTNQSSGSERPQLICDGNIQLTIGEYLGKVGDKSVFNNCISTMIADTTSKEFNSRYKENYKEDPNFLAVYGYDAVQIVSDYLAGENKSDWKDILENKKFTHDGMSGQIKFDNTGSRTLQSQLFIFRDGEFVEAQ
jgi:ABC-type branched-subunit amino acid transport system substrate-binding protein